MDTTRWDRLEALFQDALDRPADERTAWLRYVCGDDESLYRDVVGLLEADAHPAAILNGAALDALGQATLGDIVDRGFEGDGTNARPAGIGPERVGPWRVGERLGEGGMGTVYRAERADAGFEQTVALKLVRRGMDSSSVLARFRAERRILGRLEHPGIARLVDGGRAGAEAGAGYADRPYFAMEYVDGEPITAFADANQLDVDARLALVESVCEAVAFAHQNLVVHRDLKPSNLLVADTTDGPRVKLLDFGIAKLLADDAADDLTQLGPGPFTPGYAAPEQLRGDAVTTATDVYGLGAVLYRLLTGHRPTETGGRSRAELERAMLADLPPRPSAAVHGDATAAAARGTTPDRLARRLAGDLDRIVLKALAPDPGDRYPTARDLLADLERHRLGLPVEARAGSRAYVARRFVRRHRTSLTAAAAALAMVALVAAFAFARVSAERDRAEAEGAKATEVSGFLTSMLEAADPSLAEGDTLSAFDILEAGTARIDEDLAGQPEVQAEMLFLVGRVHDKLGQPSVGGALVRRSLDIRRRLFGDEHLDVAESQLRLGRILRSLDETVEAERLYRDALATQLRLAGPNSREAATTRRHLGSLLRDKGEYAEAESLYRAAIAAFAASDPPDYVGMTDAQNSLAILLEIQGRFQEATAVMREVERTERAMGATPLAIASTQKTLSTLLREQGLDAEAESATRQALATEIRILGPDHIRTSTSYRNLASILRDQEKYAEAEALYERALAIRRRVLGPNHRRVANLLDSYGKLYHATGDLGRAIEIQKEVLRIQSAGDSPSPNRVAGAQHNLAHIYQTAGRRADAERWYRSAIAVLAAAMPEDAPEHAYPLLSLGTALTEWGRAREAIPLLQRSRALQLAHLAPADPETAQSERRLSDALVAGGRPDEARAVLRESLRRLHASGADGDLIASATSRLDAVGL